MRLSDTVIRKFAGTDRAEVIALWQAVLPDTQAHKQPDPVIDAKLAVDDMLYVAVQNGKVVGTAMAGYDGHRGGLYPVAVYPQCQRQGIASELVRAAVDALKARGCLKVNLQVRAGNEAVIGFYRSLGFDTEARTSMGIRI